MPKKLRDLKLIISILVLTLALPFAHANDVVNGDDPKLQEPVLQNNDQILQAMTDPRNTPANVTGENCCDQEKLNNAHLTDNTTTTNRTGTAAGAAGVQ